MREKLFTLSRKERDALERRYKQTRDHRVAARLQCILLLHDGYNRKQVAQILRVSEKTVKRWVKSFVQLGLEQFATLHYDQSGVDCALSVEQQAQVESHLQARGCCSSKEVMDYIQQTFGLSYSESGVRKLLRRWDYCYKKPAVIPAQADREQQAGFLALYQEKKVS